MSYSFNVSGATRELAYAAAMEKMQTVVAQQPIHARDSCHHLSTLLTQLSLLPALVAGEVVHVNLSGSMCTDTDGRTTSVNVSCSVGVGRPYTL